MKLFRSTQGWFLAFFLVSGIAQARGEAPPSHEAGLERGYARFKGDRRPGILAPPEYATQAPAPMDESARAPAARDPEPQQELPSADAI